MSAEEEMRESLRSEFGKAEYPVEGLKEFIPVLSMGPATKFEGGDVSVTAMELASIRGGADFPYDDVDSLVDDIITGMKDENIL